MYTTEILRNFTSRDNKQIKDEFHDTDIEILNDGSELYFILDRFKFRATDINDFEYESEEHSDKIKNKFNVIEFHGDMLYKSGKRIPMYFYTLQRYALDVEIPVNVVRKADTAEFTATLYISFHLVENNSHGVMRESKKVYYDKIIVGNFSLFVDGKRYDSEKNTLDFEIALSDICRKMKQDYYIKSCFTCQYSEYSPYGQNDFGSMMCYRECKESYFKASNYFRYLTDNENFTYRQETFLCGEYNLRKNKGYRGFT